MSDKIKVGDRFYKAVPNGRGEFDGGWVRVTKAGRRWLYFVRAEYEGDETVYPEGPKFDANTLQILDHLYGWKGRVYRSREEYLEDTREARLWAELCREVERLRYYRPVNVGVVSIRTAAASLGIELKSE